MVRSVNGVWRVYQRRTWRRHASINSTDDGHGSATANGGGHDGNACNRCQSLAGKRCGSSRKNTDPLLACTDCAVAWNLDRCQCA